MRMTISPRKIAARAEESAVEQLEQKLEATPSQSTGPAFVQHRPISQTTLDQSELQAATNANLRAHATSDKAEALVATLAAMVEDHGISAGSRKNRRKGTAGKLEYATGAFLAYLLRALSDEVLE